MICPKCHSQNIRTRWTRRILCLDCSRTSVVWGVWHWWSRIGSGRKPVYKKTYTVPLMSSSVSAGFPSPAHDYIEKNLNISEYLIDHPLSTFVLRVKGDSMIGANIFDGDFVVVDKSIPPREWKIVIATIDGEFTCKELARDKKGNFYLLPKNPIYPSMYPKPDEDLVIWGVVVARFSKI